MKYTVQYMSLSKKLRLRADTWLAPWQWWLMAGGTFVISQLTMSWLEGLYQATLHPASVFAGQTTFNAESIKGFYAVMLDQGTLGKYVYVQIVDFAFMLTMFAALVCATVATYRSIPKVRWLKNLAWGIVLIASLGPLFDALENVVSFFMLANPRDFNNWLAIPYSTFAVIKFVLVGIGFFWTLVGIAIALAAQLYGLVMKYYAAANNSSIKQ